MQDIQETANALRAKVAEVNALSRALSSRGVAVQFVSVDHLVNPSQTDCVLFVTLSQKL